jgi:hypothetical protein
LVALQLLELQGCHSEFSLKKQLQHLPKGLDEIYGQIMQKISKGHHYEDALKILQWLAFSARALQLHEVAEVVCLVFDNNQEPYFNSSHRYQDLQAVLYICPGLISCSAGRSELHLISNEY